MAIKDEIEVVIVRSGGEVCAELETEECWEMTQGRNTHVMIELPVGEQFAIEIRVRSTFVWEGYTGLQAKLDLDMGTSVNSYPFYAIVGPRARLFTDSQGTEEEKKWTNIQSLERAELGQLRTTVDGIVMPVAGQEDQFEYMRFSTSEVSEGGAHSERVDRYQGTIRVAIQRVRFDKRASYSRYFGDPRARDVTRSTKEDLEARGIKSEICLESAGIDETRNDCARQKFKAKPSNTTDDLGIFVFHYRVPEVFGRLRDGKDRRAEKAQQRTLSITPSSTGNSSIRKRKRPLVSSGSALSDPSRTSGASRRNHNVGRMRAPSTPTPLPTRAETIPRDDIDTGLTPHSPSQDNITTDLSLSILSQDEHDSEEAPKRQRNHSPHPHTFSVRLAALEQAVRNQRNTLPLELLCKSLIEEIGELRQKLGTVEEALARCHDSDDTEDY